MIFILLVWQYFIEKDPPPWKPLHRWLKLRRQAYDDRGWEILPDIKNFARYYDQGPLWLTEFNYNPNMYK